MVNLLKLKEKIGARIVTNEITLKEDLSEETSNAKDDVGEAQEEAPAIETENVVKEEVIDTVKEENVEQVKEKEETETKN